MKISELEKVIFENTTRVNLAKGKEILDRGDLIKINFNKIDSAYNIYGSFKCEDMRKSYKTHLKIHLRDKAITLGKCDCDMFSEVHSKGSVYLCEHLTATALSFCNKVKMKLNEKIKMNAEERKDKKLLNELYKINKIQLDGKVNLNEINLANEEKKLDLNISLKEVREDKDYFEISLFAESGSVYPISNIREFITNIFESKKYHIGKGLIYTPEDFYFYKEDMEVIEYLYDYILSTKYIEDSNKIRIRKETLKSFLEKCTLKKIKFNYNYQTYISDVVEEDLPVFFTLKETSEGYVLTTRNIMPIPLNDKMDVFLFDRKIYIPSKTQIKLYRPFYNLLKEEKKILLYKDIALKHIVNLVTCIEAISENLLLDDGMISRLETAAKVKFYFEKKDSDYCCDIKLDYNNQEISYKEAINSKNEIIKRFKKMRIIESELNKNRFFYKDGTFVFRGTEDEYYLFLKEEFDSLKKIGEISILNNSNKYFKFHDEAIEAYVSGKDEKSFEFSFKLENFDNRDLMDISKAYKDKKSYIKLKDNTFVDLESEELVKFIELLGYLNLDITKGNVKNKLELNKIYYLNNRLEDKKINLVNGNEKIIEILNKLDGTKEEEFEISKDLNAVLRDYQINGVKWFKNLSSLGFGGILADEMGLGKTIQTIAFLLSEVGKQSLIVTPKSLIYNWKQEFDKFAPKLKVGIVHGSKEERFKVLDEIYDYDIILTTFGTLKNDMLEYEKSVFDYFIIDEGQNINNPESQNAKFLKMIKANNRFVLTGTPIENNLIELWSLFDFIMPGYLYTKEKFSYEFVGKEEALKDLKILINPYVLRRTKRDVIKELPEKVENRFLVEMTGPQKLVYKKYIKEVQDNLKNNKLDQSNITIFSYLTKLRQICLDPSIVMEDYEGDSGKIIIARDLISQKVNEHKILLFSQFTTVLKRLAEELEKQNIKYYYLDGSTTSKSRLKLVEEFNLKDDIRIFLISLKAGGTGLNLTSADTVIHFDPWWNLAAEDQATDRAHRIGQKHIVEVIKLIAKGTIEEKILLLQEDKKRLIEDVITGELKEGNIFNKLRKDELINLFSS